MSLENSNIHLRGFVVPFVSKHETQLRRENSKNTVKNFEEERFECILANFGIRSSIFREKFIKTIDISKHETMKMITLRLPRHLHSNFPEARGLKMRHE